MGSHLSVTCQLHTDRAGMVAVVFGASISARLRLRAAEAFGGGAEREEERQAAAASRGGERSEKPNRWRMVLKDERKMSER